MVLESLTTQTGTMPTGGSDDFDVSPPAGTPSVDGMDKDQIAGLLRDANMGGTPAVAPPAPAAPEPGQDPLEQLPPTDPAVPQPASEKKEGEVTPEDAKAAEKQANILKKFGIVDPSEAVSKMAKSYGEAETSLSQSMQAKGDSERLTSENEKLLGMAEDFQREITELKNASAKTVSDPAKMTDEEINEYNDNPKAAIAKAVAAAINPIRDKAANNERVAQQDRVMDHKVLTEMNKYKNDKSFDGLQADVEAILNDKGQNLAYTPQSVALAHHAARSVKMPQIVVEAKNQGFSAGYNKAMDEVRRGVDGGKSTIPAAGTGALGGFSAEQIEGMSAAELAKLLPNSGQ